MSDVEYLGPSSGSRWHRWEPHVHAPGTVLNDQFRGADAWEQYLAALEAASPVIRAVGVTDYYSLRSYERVREAKLAGRLPTCDLIFPNVEMRLKLGTVKGAWVNVHLLVSPEDPSHVDELERFLSRLTFRAFEDTFCCSYADLIRLGRRADPSLQRDEAALEHGSEQFKVSIDELQDAYRDSAWARGNILVAVAGGTTDGTSGVRDAADTTLRQEVEKFAHVIFASSPSARDFWLGHKVLTPDEIRRRYNGPKPCLHGSDAHEHRTVGVPDLDRYSWVKGAVIFDALRQACIEPAGRAYVGATPPIAATPSQVISRLTMNGASWMTTPTLELNPGLVAVIGARGSGKTALADIIAAGCDTIPDWTNLQSFLYRAREYLPGASVTLEWEAGGSETRPLDDTYPAHAVHYPRARYLSQQFVEELCASEGMTDALLREIERVVFEAHDSTARDGAVDFGELIDLRSARYRQSRGREEEALALLSDHIGTELEKERLVVPLKAQLAEKGQQIARYTADRGKLVATGSEERIARLTTLTKAAEKVRGYLRSLKIREQSLLTLHDEVRDVRNNKSPETLRAMQGRYAPSGFDSNDWARFLLDFVGDVDSLVAERIARVRKNTDSRTGTTPNAPQNPEESLIAADADLERLPLGLLQAEINRLEKLVSLDRDAAAKFASVSKRIADESATQDRLKERLEDCEQAKARRIELVQERGKSYVRVFESILAEQKVLTELYAPLMMRLAASGGVLNKLSFSVMRVADVELWANEGEALLDLRRLGPFKGRGTLQQRAEGVLRDPWESGTANEIAIAMTSFREDHQAAFLEHSPVPRINQADYRAWTKRFAQWLYSTNHISVQYSVEYDGVDIRKLSPGTRGLVLLLLYLALDDADDRPLIIDQPEENLDPKSVFDELVALFIQAKNKRQVIIITHNANLVVNTDADQIIIANSGPHQAGTLPPITYQSGGLESAYIRKAVCDILEGGEQAFRERARRLRVQFER